MQRLSREKCIEKLKEIGQHGPGTRLFLHKDNTSFNAAWKCSLDPSEVPGIKAKWSSDEKVPSINIAHSSIREKRKTRESHWNVAEQKNCYCQNYNYMSNLEYLLEL